ncbi:OLC1v1008746C1 [Oldenlandia corymbosa var. corymbosa]|uniref:OLC1v1008746C1 n=1 Tax=Oldenlandia corymbosa var. corymbosa TaxID=529605 RepID=A0AAV1DM97_OLDCO|nr:OLC1v1008746C1 [Oldenlandia corymbosa var. corymbosa]
MYQRHHKSFAKTSYSEEGADDLVYMFANVPQCCLKVLVLSKCQLGQVGILKVLEALSQNCWLEELYLADNIYPNKENSHQRMPVKESSYGKQANANSSSKVSASEETASTNEVCAIAAEENQVDVAGNGDDDRARETTAKSASSEIHISSTPESEPSLDGQFIQKLLDTIEKATELQILDLSNNQFCRGEAEELYAAWSSGSRAATARSHISNGVIHLSVQGRKCCGKRPCCRRT